jgi:hypothetical protein
LLETPTKQQTVEILAETISIPSTLDHKEGVFAPTQQPRRLTKSFAEHQIDQMKLVQKERKIEIEKKRCKVFCMSLRSYDSLTETAYIFFGGRSTFFVTEY